MCGRRQPSAAHLIWACGALTDERSQHNVAPPTDRAQERLLLAGIPPRPPRRTTWRYDSLQDVVAEELTRRLCAAPQWLCLATDGGAKWDFTTMGFAAIDLMHAVFSIGHPCITFDPTPYAAELLALHSLLMSLGRAACDVQRRRTTKMCILVDCLGVVDSIHDQTHRSDYQLTVGDNRRLLAQCRAQLDLDVVWVPSHDKRREEWAPPHPIPEPVARRANAAADAAATAAFSDDAAVPFREWQRCHSDAIRWQRGAVALARAVGRRNLAHLWRRDPPAER